MEQWRDPTIDNSASCDGVAWEIVYYSNGGIIINSSERLDYIYGHSAMETIVSCLPDYINAFSSSAFISVTRIVPAYLADGVNAAHRVNAWNKKGNVPLVINAEDYLIIDFSLL